MIVLSAVGSVTARVVSKESAVEPSNIISLIFGLVKVLFVSVSVPVNETKLSPCNPALNSPRVPVNVPKSSRSICNVLALLLIVLFVNVSVVALPTSVSLAFGNVIVLSAVGSTTAKVVSKLSAVLPSNTIVGLLIVGLLIVGLVSVLFVSVSLPVNETKLSLCKAVLNSAKEPVSVLLPKSIDLFVNVSVVALPTSVSLALDGSVSVISLDGLPGVKVVSKLSSVEPSKTREPVMVPDNAIVSVAALPSVIVLPCVDDVPTTVKLPSTCTLAPVSYTHLTLPTKG